MVKYRDVCQSKIRYRSSPNQMSIGEGSTFKWIYQPIFSPKIPREMHKLLVILMKFSLPTLVLCSVLSCKMFVWKPALPD